MHPTLRKGMLVLAMRFLHIGPGDVVIVRHDNLEKVKRVEKIRDDKVFLTGDNPDSSTDSRNFGWLPQKAIMAKVIWPGTRLQGIDNQ